MARAIPWLLVGAFSAWFFSLTPSHERRWPPEQARMARATIEGDRVHLENVRSFRWRSGTEAEERWVTRELDLSRVSGLDVIVSSWGWQSLVHTIVSFTIEGEDPLPISIESRREVGEPFDPLRGFLRQYELIYVLADEVDLLELRAIHRHERVQLLRTRTSPETARAILVAYLEETRTLAEHPAFYDSLSRNCSTAARRHVAAAGVRDTWDWRVVLNGHVDELLYERGLLDDSRSLAQLRRESEVTERIAVLEEPGWSQALREHVPTPR